MSLDVLLPKAPGPVDRSYLSSGGFVTIISIKQWEFSRKSTDRHMLLLP